MAASHEGHPGALPQPRAHARRHQRPGPAAPMTPRQGAQLPCRRMEGSETACPPPPPLPHGPSPPRTGGSSAWPSGGGP
eukprot:12980434-Alexandrium_andersonii.AAC.1